MRFRFPITVFFYLFCL